MTSWLDTPAGLFHSASGDPSMPTADDFARADQEEMRIAARRAFDMAHRPGEKPARPYSAEDLQRVYAERREAIYAQANWITNDSEIAERIRRMRVGLEAVKVAESAQYQSPGQPDPAYAEAQRRMRGVPGATS